MNKRITENGIVESTNGMPPALNEKSTKRNYKQIYRKDWETNPLFQGWLSSVPCNKHKAECTACKKELLAHRLTLLKHASSAKHLKRVTMVCSPTGNETPPLPNDAIAENDLKSTKETRIEKFEVDDGTSSNNDKNTIDILPQLVNLNNAKTAQFTNTKMKIDHDSLNISKQFAEEMEAQLSQLTAEEVATNSVSLETVVSDMQATDTSVTTNPAPENIPNLIIHANSFVSLSETPEAIKFKHGYVTKNEPPQRIICAATFLDDKIPVPGSANVTNKITYPLQISTRVTDYSRGISAANLSITLYMLTGGKWVSVGESVTDDVGRCNMFHKNHTFFSVGLYKLHYNVATYYSQQDLKSYFPFVEIVFQMRSMHETHHIPLMISPNGYTAYRSMDY